MSIHKNARLTRHGRERIVRLAASGQIRPAYEYIASTGIYSGQKPNLDCI
jgi:hypothetical protein